MTELLELVHTAPAHRRGEGGSYWGGAPELRHLVAGGPYDSSGGWAAPVFGANQFQRFIDLFGSAFIAPPAVFAMPNPFYWQLGSARSADNPFSTTQTRAKYPHDPDLYFIADGLSATGEETQSPLFNTFVGALEVQTTLGAANSDGVGGFVPDIAPVMGYLVVSCRHLAGTFTPDTATPYTLTLTTSEAGVGWSSTIDPLSEVLTYAWVPRVAPFDAARITYQMNVAQDATHPHRIYVVRLPRHGLYVQRQALPSGYELRTPPWQTQFRSHTFASVLHGKSGATSAKAWGGSPLGARSMGIWAGLGAAARGVERLVVNEGLAIQHGNDFKPTACFASWLTTPGNQGLGGTVVETATLDWRGWNGSTTQDAPYEVRRYENWNRGNGIFASASEVVLGSFVVPKNTSPFGPPAQGSITLSETPPKGGGYVRLVSTPGGISGSDVLISTRRDYSTPPPYCCTVLGGDDIIPGGAHPDQVFSTRGDGRNLVLATGPAGGGAVSVAWPADARGGSGIIDVTWPDCAPGLFEVQTSSNGVTWTHVGTASVVGDDLAGPLNLGYARNGIRRAQLPGPLTSAASTIWLRTVDTPSIAPDVLAIGTTSLVEPSRTITGAGPVASPFVAQFTAPSAGRYRFAFNWRGTNDSTPPALTQFRAIIQRASGAVKDGYQDDRNAVLAPPQLSLSLQLQAIDSFPLPAHLCFASAFPSVLPTTVSQVPALVFFALAADSDWTATPWAGRGGQVAYARIPRRVSTSPHPVPTDTAWSFFDVPDGTHARLVPATGAAVDRIRDRDHATGWRPVVNADGVDVHEETLALEAGEIVTWRIARLDSGLLGGNPASSWAGRQWFGQARWRVTVAAL